MRVSCNTDHGDYSSILQELDKVIKAAKSRGIPPEKKFLAKTLRTTLRSLFSLVQSHTMNGHSGVAGVLYQELSGLAGSSMIRRVSRTLRDNAGKSQRGGGAASAPPAVGGFSGAPKRGSSGGRGRFGAMRQNYLNRAGRGGNAGAPRKNNLQCFECLEFGHGYQQCPTKKQGQ